MIKKVFIGLSSFILGVLLCGIQIGCKSSNPTEGNDYDLIVDYDNEFRGYLAEAQEEMGMSILTMEDIENGLIPKAVTINGNHYDLGRLFGKIARKYYGSVQVPLRTSRNEALNQQIVEMYSRVSPHFLEMVRGTADASGLTLDDVDLIMMENNFYNDLWWRIFHYYLFIQNMGFDRISKNTGENCSVVSYLKEETGQHLIGRNFDNPSDRPHFVVETQMDDVYRVMGNACYALYHWIADGVNDQGLFIGVATNGYPTKYNVNEYYYPDEPAVQVIHMVRIALESCATVDEVIELYKSVRIWFPAEVNHLLVSDRAGHSAVIEFDTDRNLVEFHRQKHYMVLTNTAYQEGLDYVNSVCPRFATATRQLENGIDSQTDLFTVMQSMQPWSSGYRSLWTAMFDLSRLTMDVYFLGDRFDTKYPFNF